MTLTLTKPEITVKPGGRLHENLDTPQLVELALRRGEGRMSEHGALVVETGTHTGRSAQDKFIVRDVETKDRSEEHTSELQSLMRISYAVFCLKQKIQYKRTNVALPR